MRFYPSQQVVCIAKSLSFDKPTKWWEIWKRRTPIGPKFNEIVTVEAYPVPHYLYLKEYPHIQKEGQRGNFHESIFEPLVSNEELYKALKEETTTA